MVSADLMRTTTPPAPGPVLRPSQDIEADLEQVSGLLRAEIEALDSTTHSLFLAHLVRRVQDARGHLQPAAGPSGPEADPW